MSGIKAILVGVVGFFMFGGLAQVSTVQAASPNTEMYSVSGTIEWIDVKLGKLKLDADEGQDTRGITEYRINKDQTRVTDPSDKKFLVIKDLRAGQHVTIEVKNSYGENLIRKIIAEAIPEPVFQEAIGELEAIDMQAGTLVIERRPLSDEGRKGDLVYFVFDPNSIVLMRTPGKQPVQLELNPGDVVQVEFVVRDGTRHARSITLLSSSSETTSTTTTTTTKTTVKH
jgi:hypothetical protein